MESIPDQFQNRQQAAAVLSQRLSEFRRWYRNLKELTGDQLIFLLHHFTGSCDRRTLQAVNA